MQTRRHTIHTQTHTNTSSHITDVQISTFYVHRLFTTRKVFLWSILPVVRSGDVSCLRNERKVCGRNAGLDTTKPHSLVCHNHTRTRRWAVGRTEGQRGVRSVLEQCQWCCYIHISFTASLRNGGLRACMRLVWQIDFNRWIDARTMNTERLRLYCVFIYMFGLGLYVWLRLV